MANVVLNVGDKLILDGNDPTNPNDTFITNPANYPSNRIEVWLNGSKRAEYRDTKLVLHTDVEFTADAPILRCHGGLKVHLDADDIHPAFRSFQVNAGPPGGTVLNILDVDQNAILANLSLRFTSTTAAHRKIQTESGSLEVAAQGDLILRTNAKGTAHTSKVRISDATVEVVTIDNAGATVNGSMVVSGPLLVGGTSYFGGKVDAQAEGIRTKSIGLANPTGGDPGDIVLRYDTNRLFVNVNGTWKSVLLS